MVILSFYWGNLDVKWRNGIAYKSKNAKIEIGLNPPPLKDWLSYPANITYRLALALVSAINTTRIPNF